MHMDVHLNWYREKAVDAAHNVLCHSASQNFTLATIPASMSNMMREHLKHHILLRDGQSFRVAVANVSPRSQW